MNRPKNPDLSDPDIRGRFTKPRLNLSQFTVIPYTPIQRVIFLIPRSLVNRDSTILYWASQVKLNWSVPHQYKIVLQLT